MTTTREISISTEHFFMVYKDLEEKKTAVLGWHDLDETLEIIAASRAAYRG